MHGRACRSACPHWQTRRRVPKAANHDQAIKRRPREFFSSGGQRAAFLRFLAHAAPVSTSHDRRVEQGITFLLAHRTDRRARRG